MNLAEKEIVVYGDLQNLYDLKYVFDEFVFTKNTQDTEELLNLISEGNYAILCGADNKEIHDRITSSYGEEFCCTDRELIKSLNYPLSEKTEGRPFYIWGTGFWCDRFLEFLEDKPDITIEGFIDSDPQKQGQNKCGIKIISPDEIENDFFIAAAVNKEHYLEIERDLREKGFPKDNYISVHTVMDDVAGFFSRVYESDTYLPVFCRNRDDNIRILTDGNICTCCLARKSIYGNIYFNSLEEIWTSKRARIARLSLIKRAYVYCETSRCPYLCGVPKLKRDNEVIPGKYEEKESFRQWPESIAPEIDGSCNLYCKSCRKEIFVDTSKEREIYADLIIKKIVPLPTRLIINTVGEPFASRNSLKVIHAEETRAKGCISIYTNGTLLTPARMDELLEEYRTIELSISIDAATKETYEKLRRGGNYDRLMENISYISKKRAEGYVTYLQFNFVIQADNIHELQKFIHFAKDHLVDYIAVNAIENWGHFSEEEFDKISIMDSNEKLKEKYRTFFNREVLDEPGINFHNLSYVLGKEPVRMHMI